MRMIRSSLANISASRLDFSVTVDLDQALVADPEMMGDLVQDDAPDLPLEPTAVVPVEALERAAVDRNLVRQRARVAAAAPRQRNPLVEAEERLPRRRLVRDDDGHVRHAAAQVGRQRVERTLNRLLELRRAVLQATAPAPRGCSPRDP